MRACPIEMERKRDREGAARADAVGVPRKQSFLGRGRAAYTARQKCLGKQASQSFSPVCALTTG